VAEPQVSARGAPVLELAVTDLATGREYAVIQVGGSCADTLARYMEADPGVLRVEVVRDDLSALDGGAA
jgi:hypothetical protein